MIRMTMRDQNMRHAFAGQRRLQGLEVDSVFRTRIDHAHIAMPDDVNAGSDISEGSGIVGNYAADQR